MSFVKLVMNGNKCSIAGIFENSFHANLIQDTSGVPFFISMILSTSLETAKGSNQLMTVLSLTVSGP